jgi:hypothetical protein
MTDDGKIPSAGSPALVQKACTFLDNTVTFEDWENGTKAHGTIAFSSDESNVGCGDHWLSIWATTKDATPKILTLCAGVVRILEVGGGNDSIPPDPIEIYYTAADCDDKFVPLAAIDTDADLGNSDTLIPSQKAVKTYVDGKVVAGEGNLGEDNTASNLGTGIGIFQGKVGVDLQFKSLKAGQNISISASASEITLAAAGGGGESNVGGMENPMEEIGDIIVGGESGSATRLGKGTAGQVLTVGEEALEWVDSSASYSLPAATTDTLGGIKVGSLLSIADGTLSATDQSYSLPAATTDTLGGIKPDGTTISVDSETGIASVIGGGGGSGGLSNGWTPSTQYVDLTVGNSGYKYTALADGWVYASGSGTSTNSTLRLALCLGNALIMANGVLSYISEQMAYTSLPVSLGSIFRLDYSNFAVLDFRFVYSKGAL